MRISFQLVNKIDTTSHGFEVGGAITRGETPLLVFQHNYDSRMYMLALLDCLNYICCCWCFDFVSAASSAEKKLGKKDPIEDNPLTTFCGLTAQERRKLLPIPEKLAEDIFPEGIETFDPKEKSRDKSRRLRREKGIHIRTHKPKATPDQGTESDESEEEEEDQEEEEQKDEPKFEPESEEMGNGPTPKT